MNQKPTTSELLGQCVNIFNTTGPDSLEFRQLLREHEKNEDFISLANTAADLHRLLETVKQRRITEYRVILKVYGGPESAEAAAYRERYRRNEIFTRYAAIMDEAWKLGDKFHPHA